MTQCPKTQASHGIVRTGLVYEGTPDPRNVRCPAAVLTPPRVGIAERLINRRDQSAARFEWDRVPPSPNTHCCRSTEAVLLATQVKPVAHRLVDGVISPTEDDSQSSPKGP